MTSQFSLNNRFRLFFALNFTAIGIFSPFLALYLASIHLSGSQIGLLLAIIPLAGFLVQPLWGLMSDVYGLRRRALVVACFCTAAGTVLFGMTTDFRLLFVLTLITAVTKGPIGPLGTALALEHLDNNGNRPGFGSFRLWGSIGFAIAAFVIGALVVEGAVWRIIPVYAVVMFALGLIALALPDAEIREEVNWRQGIMLLKQERQLARFFVSCLLIGATLGIVNSYLAVYLNDIHAPGWVIGAALALAALLEVPLMGQVPALLARWGMRLVLVGGVAVLPFRWLLYAIITEPLLVVPTQVLHSIAMMALLVVGVLYVDQQLARPWRATGQALCAAALHGIGPALGLFVGGLIYERAGIAPMWLVSALVALIGVVVLDWAVRTPVTHAARGEVPS
ncbi:MAG: MFS transporter [Ardenticatenaceae bacterium]|nr:MFS transporter [Ardenticatenaceae bacterium]